MLLKDENSTNKSSFQYTDNINPFTNDYPFNSTSKYFSFFFSNDNNGNVNFRNIRRGNNINNDNNIYNNNDNNDKFNRFIQKEMIFKNLFISLEEIEVGTVKNVIHPKFQGIYIDKKI